MNEQKRKPVGILLTVILIAALLTICLELGLSYLRPDTPGSIPKHLIHFGIMFALLGGAVLLCLFCPPFKKLWAWIDEHILTQETRPIAIDIIYAVIAGLMLLHHFYVLLYYPTIPAGASKLSPIWIIFAATTIFFSKAWQNCGFRIAAIFLIYTFERLFFKHLNITDNNIVYFISAIYAICICYGVFSSLRKSVWKPFLHAICFIWALGILALSLIGLYTAWTGIQLTNLAEAHTFIEEGRLGIFSIPTITAGNLCCGIIMGFIGFAISTHKSTKITYLIISLVNIIANSLTDSRSSFIMISFLIAGMVCLGIWTLYRKKDCLYATRKKTLLVLVSMILCFCLCVFLTIESQHFLGSFFVKIRDQGVLLPAAQAEETESEVVSRPEFQQRNIWISENETINWILSDRYRIWIIGSRYINSSLQSLLFGTSMDGSVATIVEREDHSHNMLLQILLEGGLCGLLLFLLLILYFVYFSFRLWNRKGIPFWQRILPLPVFSILLWEMAECLTHFSYGHPPMTLFRFFLGATITVSKSLGKAPKTAEQPAIPAESAVTETGE